MTCNPFHIVLSLMTALWIIAGTGCSQPPPRQTILEVRTTPKESTIFVDGKEQGTSGLRLLVSPGEHLIQVRAHGFVDTAVFTQAVEGKSVLCEVKLDPAVVPVRIESTPSGASVRLDGSDIGTTPATLPALPFGEHEIEVAMTGFETAKQTLLIDRDAPVRHHISLNSVMGSLSVFCPTPRAEIVIDGKQMGVMPPDGKTPVVINDLPAGSYKLTARLPGYHAVEQDIILRKEENKAINLDALSKLPAGVTITSTPAGATVLDYQGRQLGVTPLELSNLRPDTYTFRVELSGFVSETIKVRALEGQRFSANVELKKYTGGISLQTQPPGASVYVDGELVGTTTESPAYGISNMLSVDSINPGRHRLTVQKTGFVDVNRTFAVQVGRMQNLGSITLREIWLPTHRLTLKSGRVYEGRLVRKGPEGNVDFEREGGVSSTYEAREVESIMPLTPE